MSAIQEPRSVVESFLQAVEQRDFDRARGYLSWDRFRYVGPTRTFDSPEDFMANLILLEPILEKVIRRRWFMDGDEVCLIATYVTSMEALRNIRTAQWMKVEDGKIVSMEVFFDAHAYAKMFEV
jgi:ketosteroid isomerase-like protein